MGRPPSNGGPAFRFTPSEVAELETCLKGSNNQLPSREAIASLAENFSASLERAGKIAVQPKQVWNWFQNRRYSQRARLVKPPAKLPVSSAPREDSISHRDGSDPVSVTQGKKTIDGSQLEFEAKSARDAAWYDVAAFLSHRNFETGDLEVRIRFAGFGVEEDEWVNVRRCVRQRSLPCEPAECSVVLPGDLILCFQEGNEQALYFDARVLDAQRRRHDVRGCRCRFLVRYDHDQSEEIVPLKKICRRPETEYRIQLLHGSKLQTSRVDVPVTNDHSQSQIGKSKDSSMTVHTAKKESKAADVKMDAVVSPAQQKEPESLEVPPTEDNTSSIPVSAGGTT